MTKFGVTVGWSEVPHLSPQMIAEETARIPPYLIKAKSEGIPSLGAGAIYPVDLADVVCDPFVIPDWMAQCYAFDVGWNRTAALWGAHDKDSDIVYLYSEHYRGEGEPPVHAAAFRARGTWIPGVFDPAARSRSQLDGRRLLQAYQDLGLENITDADHSVEAGLYEVWIRLATGRLKVFRTLQNWVQECRFYQRDEKGRIKDGQADHLMDCTRYLVLSGLLVAIPRPASLWTPRAGQSHHESDYDPYAAARGPAPR